MHYPAKDAVFIKIYYFITISLLSLIERGFFSDLEISDPPGKVFLNSLAPDLSIVEDGTAINSGSSNMRQCIGKPTESHQNRKKSWNPNQKSGNHWGIKKYMDSMGIPKIFLHRDSCSEPLGNPKHL